MSLNAKIIELISLHSEGNKEEYQKFFQSAMKKFGIKSPTELDDKKKKEFFNYIDKNYDAKNEDVLKENPAVIATAARMAVQNAQGKKVSVNTARQKDYREKDPKAHKKAKSIFDKIKDKFKSKKKPTAKGQKLKTTNDPKKSDAQKYSDLYGGGAKVESTASYAASLEKIAKDRQLRMISKKDKMLLAKLAKMMKNANESMNEGDMELKKLEDAIKMFQKKIEKQGRVTNARDEDHLKNLIKIYKQMGGKKIKESVNEGLLKEDIQDLEKIVKELENASKMHAGQAKRIQAHLDSMKQNEASMSWEWSDSRIADEISKIFRLAGIKVKSHRPFKKPYRIGDSALYGAFITAMDDMGEKTVLPIEVDKNGLVTYAGGPKGWHKMEKLGRLNMSHAKPKDYLRFKGVGQPVAFLKAFKKMPGFGQDVIKRK
tara:strand:+ start:14921 stop:16210 length:1290 start_codon:yes stop_codon:yes gene_type:complete